MVKSGSVPTREIAYGTDADGAFAMSLPSGRFTLAAYGPSNLTGDAEVSTEDEEDESVQIVVD